MLGESPVCGTIAVKDIEAGKSFYGGTLGLNQLEETMGGVMYESGGGKLFVYESQTAGTGQATCASWRVSEIGSVVSELKARGVVFDTFDLPGAQWDGEVASLGGVHSAWFKDPDGNALNVNSV